MSNELFLVQGRPTQYWSISYNFAIEKLVYQNVT